MNVASNVISTVQENAFSHCPRLEVVKMDSSSVLCDCYLKWFPRWLNDTGVTGCEAASCAHPENLKGRTIQTVAYESYTCDDFPKPYILQQPTTQVGARGEEMASVFGLEKVFQSNPITRKAVFLQEFSLILLL